MLRSLARGNDNEEVVRLKSRFVQGFLKFFKDVLEQIEYVIHIFNLFKEQPDDKTIQKRKLTDQLKRMGILSDDPRIQKMIEYFKEYCDADIDIMQLTKAMGGRGMRCNPHI